MEFWLGHSISKDRFFAVARKIFGGDLSKIRVRPDASTPLSDEDKGKDLGMSQHIREDYLGTSVTATEDDSIDPHELARALATEGGVDVLWYDDTGASGEEEWDWAGFTTAPYILFKPDGSEHRARMDEHSAADEVNPRGFAGKLIVLD